MSRLVIKDLCIGYKVKTLLPPINATLDEGSLVGLVGQNGVGKSTLIRTISGFQKALGGTIAWDGINSSDFSPSDLAKKMAVVLTEKPMAMNLTALELISLGRHPYSSWLGKLKKEDLDVIEKAVDQTQIQYLLNLKLYQLSDGQLQKVMITRALVQETDTILLDEPTSHLDLRNKIEVLDLLKEISQKGKSILISTHEVSLAAKVCDLFWGVDFGQELEVCEPTKMTASGRLAEMLHLKDGVI